MGVVSSIGCSTAEFASSLREGRSGVVDLTKSGRGSSNVRIGAVMPDFNWREQIQKLAMPAWQARASKVLNNTTASTRWSACAALQACAQAGLFSETDLAETALIVAGSNLSQEYVAQNAAKFASPEVRFNPRYALSFFDTNQLGCISEILGLKSTGWTVGAASASGNAALFQAWHGIRSGLWRRCLVVGAGCEFSALELEAFALIGAAYTGASEHPAKCCRPFDRNHKGFVWGEGSAALLLENAEAVQERGAKSLGELAGASLQLDGHHTPDPTVEGEARAMTAALAAAGISPAQVALVNAHGTASPLGDKTEAAALRQVFGAGQTGPLINSTKALTGHCMSASGMLEAAACLIQLNEGFIHPNINLEQPIDPELHFASATAEAFVGDCAVSNGFGFGGINSSLVFKKPAA